MNPGIEAALIDVFFLIVPELVLGAAACVLFVAATFRPDRNLYGLIALLGVLGALVALWFTPLPGTAEDVRLSQWLPELWARLGDNPLPYGNHYASALLLDRMALFVKAVSILGGLVLVLFAWNEVPDRQAAEYHACLLILTAGLCLVGSANELVTLFLALELVSIPTYVMLYLPRYDGAAQEAAVKYFLLSVFSSAFLLFGFSYVYGMTGTTNLSASLETLAAAGPTAVPLLAPVALVMIAAGLGFRIAAVPFHFYAPDVYQGTATVNAGLLAFAPKVAGFVALIRVFGYAWGGHAGSGQALSVHVPMLLYILAAVTMSLGNLLALLQENLKRLLAYSSVAHAGYMLIGLAVAGDLRSENVAGGVDGVLFYLVAYGAMTLGAFAVIACLGTSERPVETVDDLAGLSRSHPRVALLMALFLFSLIGIPLTAGFVGKFVLFFGAVAAPAPPTNPWLFKILALIGALNAAVGAWYYLRILAVMYLRTPVKPLDRPRSWPGLATIGLCAVVTVVLGVYPRLLLDPAREAAGAPPAAGQRAEAKSN